MNKGFLSFAAEDDTDLTMLKEEPDDLVNLTTPCMPLDETAPLFGEMLVGLIGSYENLLPDDINSLDSTTSSNTESGSSASPSMVITTGQDYNGLANYHSGNGNSKANNGIHVTANGSGSSNNGNNASHKGELIDPFINYREESNDTNCSQHLLSPSVTSKSPEASSLPSLCSPNSLSQEDEFPFMTMSVDDDIDDLTMRAPYIPMNEQDDLPLLTDDLMWCGSDAFTAEDLNMHKDTDAIQQLQLHQQQQQHNMENNRSSLGYQAQQQQQQQFSNSLCSSPASTVSSLSPSPVNQRHHQQSPESGIVFTTDSSELAALLCGSGSGTLSILTNNCSITDSSDECNDRDVVGIGNANLSSGQQSSHPQCPNDVIVEDFRVQQALQQLQEQQQHQQRLLGLSIDCKKEKFENSIASSLCDSIEDAFQNVYNKDSANLDCWNDLLQINVSESSAAPPPRPTTTPSRTTAPSASQQQQQQQLELQQQQESILLNAVPLITIQNNNHINNNHHHNNKSLNNGLIINEEITQRGGSGSKGTAVKLLNSVIPSATIRVIEGNNNKGGLPTTQPQQQQQKVAKATKIQQQLQQHGNKRHLAGTAAATQMDTKRLKSAIDLQTPPQLLQQLIGAPLQQQQQTQQVATTSPKEQHHQQKLQQQQRRATTVAPNARWCNTGADCAKAQQQSDSVLKNLLISGCDDAPSPKANLMLLDDNCMDQSLDMELSPPLDQPLRCLTSTASVLRSFRHNPMIGGPGVLPSPTFSDDSNPPGLTRCPSDLEMSNDSGIDGVVVTSGCENVGVAESVSVKAETLSKAGLIVPAKLAMPAVPPPLIGGASGGGLGVGQNRKTSISFMDSSNPLVTPFMIDLCNDDYNMSGDQYLGGNDIEHVLNEWTHEMVE